MAIYVTDTHPLLWYASNQRKKLSKKALKAFDKASNNQALIYVPAVALWEVALLAKSGHIKLSSEFKYWAAALLAKQGFDFAPMDAEVMSESINLSFNDDPFDGAIVATAKIMDLPLITKDEAIRSANIVDIEW